MADRGLIVPIILGIASLVITTIIAFIIVSNVAVVHTPLEAATGVAVVVNETGAYVNDTGYNVSRFTVTGFTTPVITKLYNATSGLEFDVGNATITDAGLVKNASAATDIHWEDVLISYTYNYKEATTSVEQLRSNFTTGINNVSNKIPTVLLIAAVVIIFGILYLLWQQYGRMSIGDGGGI